MSSAPASPGRPRRLRPRRTCSDLPEAELLLRETLLECSARLVDLDVARWRPEAAEGLSALRAGRSEPLPPVFEARAQRVAALALRCLALSDLALDDDGGSVSAYEASERRDALASLARTARHALVAACSTPVRAH